MHSLFVVQWPVDKDYLKLEILSENPKPHQDEDLALKGIS